MFYYLKKFYNFVMKKPELLMPAGNLEKLDYAITFRNCFNKGE